MIDVIEVYSTEFINLTTGSNTEVLVFPPASGRGSPLTLSVVGWISTEKFCRGSTIDNMLITCAKNVNLKFFTSNVDKYKALPTFDGKL